MDLYELGLAITMIMLFTGGFITAVATLEPTFASIGGKKIVTNDIGIGEINSLIEAINNDFSNISITNPLTIVVFGGTALINGGSLIITTIISTFANSLAIFSLLFMFAGTAGTLLAAPFQIVFGLIMLYTIFTFVISVIRGQPYYGGG